MKVYEGPSKTTIELEITKDLDKIISALELKAYDYATDYDDMQFYMRLLSLIKDSNQKKDLNLFFT